MSDKKDLRAALGGILGDLKTYIRFQESMGVDGLQIRAEVREQPGAKPSGTVVKEQAPVSPGSVPVSTQLGIFDRTGRFSTLEEISEEIGDCTRCKLCEGRTTIVFGEGSSKARIVFVGEGPGADEDAQGRPFVGRAGKLLTKIIEAMGFAREDVYICNVVKCRPPGNRNPESDEIGTCMPFLLSQLQVIDPEIIICLGSVAAHALLRLKKGTSVSSLRGQFHALGRSKVVVTYHTAALLRNPGFRKPLWEDMKMALAEIGLKPPRE